MALPKNAKIDTNFNPATTTAGGRLTPPKPEELELNSSAEVLEEEQKRIQEQKKEKPVTSRPAKFKVKKTEKKTKRVQIVLKPSTFDKLQALSNKTGVSVNGIVNDLLENYLV